MKNKELLLKLEKTFEELGIKIKYEKLKTDGGYCRYKDKKYVIINKITPIKTRIDILKDALRQMVKEDDIYLLPEIRDIIEENNENY